jgi:hypothetical protein
MLTYGDAVRIARRHIDSIHGPGKAELMLDHTIDRWYGWVFSYQSARYLKTQDALDLIVSAQPFLVALSGRITAKEPDETIEQFLTRYENTPQ